MAARRAGEQNPFWKRMELVMKVYMGQMSATEAARELGISRTYFYQLEEEMLGAALEAVTPGKPGPKVPEPDPAQVKQDDALQGLLREKELLALRVKHLEEIQREMLSRGLGVLREKKRSRPPRPRGHGKALHAGVQGDGAGSGSGAQDPGRIRPGPLRRGGPQPGESGPLEGAGEPGGKAGPQGTGGGA